MLTMFPSLPTAIWSISSLSGHDSFLDIRTRTDETYQKVIENLKKFSWIEVYGNSKNHASDTWKLRANG